MPINDEKIIVLVSERFPEREATRFRTPDYTLLGFHPTAARAFLRAAGHLRGLAV